VLTENKLTDAREILGSLVGDPRTVDIEPKFQTIISNVASFFGKVAQLKGKRATHSFGTVASGILEVLPNLSIPSHRVFSSGNSFPVLLRHANIKGFPDDAIIDGRGASIRILNGAADAPINSLDLDDFLADILMSTGHCFTFSNAATFSRWLASSLEDRAKMLPELPKFLPIFHEIVRNPESYTKLHYYSETTYLFKSNECEPQDYYMRYRLINADRSPDSGFVPIEDIRLPLDFLPRLANDFRPANYLRQDFRQRVTQGGVSYILQIQLQPVSDDHAKNELAKDCTEAWDETIYPFQDVAQLTLNSMLPDEVAEQLELNAYHAPADLALILAHSVHETASINHVRSIVYEISANMRKYQPPSSELVDWGVDKVPAPKDVYKYFGVAGTDIPRLDPNLELPPRVAPKPRLAANIGLSVIPAKQLAPGKLLGISGIVEIIQQVASPAIMPANLTRCRPDKFSDAFFVERRLNGFNPGKMKPAKDQPWQYIIRYNCPPEKYEVKPGGIFPTMIEARFVLTGQTLAVHSIEYELNGATVLNLPGQADWEWAKRLFRSVEFVLQEAQSHLARTHLNVEQYAMPYYRNVINNPIKLLLEPHFEGLLNVNKLGASIIFGKTGIIPQASALNEVQVEKLIVEEVSELNFHDWHPRQHVLPDVVANNFFDPAALAAWGAIEEYVSGFFAAQGEQITKHWSEIEAMSADLVEHSILNSKYGTLAIANITELQKLCTYLIYHSSFLHSWLNYKQYEDGGDVDYATLGLWDSHDPHYNPMDVTQKQIQQVLSVWTLSQVRYNPILENGNPALKELLWQRRDKINPGLPLETMMNSIHI
jgi:linolenate 9R-lipoxygenase